jgi:NAD(P)-dependent dehydrogenase (short-subunit alcohol dehydrogenase family)
MKYELKQMLKQGGGSIVNASSIAGVSGWELLTPYVAAKHGVSGMTKNAAIEYAKDGIRVNATCPGSILTPLVEGFMADQPDTMTEESLGSVYPMGRVGRSPEVGEAVAWLCSDKASFVTGILVPIDGGYVAR